jgi:hypothetical protein
LIKSPWPQSNYWWLLNDIVELTNLKTLKLYDSSSEDLQKLSLATHLQTLELPNSSLELPSSSIEPSSIKAIQQMTTLQNLGFRGIFLDSQLIQLSNLSCLTRLRKFNLILYNNMNNHNPFSNQAIEDLKMLTQIETLSLSVNTKTWGFTYDTLPLMKLLKALPFKVDYNLLSNK